jgi:ribose transport system substrate-binding protein
MTHAPAGSLQRPRRHLIQVVDRACDILTALRGSQTPLKLAEVCAHVGLSASTAFRILDTLCAKGLVEHSPRRGYLLGGPALPERRFRLGYAAQSSEFAFSRTTVYSLEQAAKAAHIELLTANNRFSRTVALKNADYFVRQRVDLVIEFQTFVEIAPLLAAKYHDAGIPMIAVEIPHPGATYYGADNYRAGRIGGTCLGKWAKQHWRGRVDEVLLLEQSAAGALPQSRLTGTLDGIMAALPHFSHGKVVYLESHGQFHGSLAAVRKHLSRTPPGNTLIGAVNDPSAIGALRAFEEAGRTCEYVAVSQNASEEAREEMRRAGTRLIGSVAYFPENYGAEIVALALDILHHKPVPPAVFTRHHLITPDNVDHFYATDALPAAMVSG